MDIKFSKWRDRHGMLRYINSNPNINVISITYEKDAYNPYVFYYTLKNEKREEQD